MIAYLSQYALLTLATLLFLLALTAVPVMAGIGVGMMVCRIIH